MKRVVPCLGTAARAEVVKSRAKTLIRTCTQLRDVLAGALKCNPATLPASQSGGAITALDETEGVYLYCDPENDAFVFSMRVMRHEFYMGVTLPLVNNANCRHTLRDANGQLLGVECGTDFFLKQDGDLAEGDLFGRGIFFEQRLASGERLWGNCVLTGIAMIPRCAVFPTVRAAPLLELVAKWKVVAHFVREAARLNKRIRGNRHTELRNLVGGVLRDLRMMVDGMDDYGLRSISWRLARINGPREKSSGVVVNCIKAHMSSNRDDLYQHPQ